MWIGLAWLRVGLPLTVILIFCALVLAVVRAPDVFVWLGVDVESETDQTGAQRQVLLLLLGGVLAAVTALLSWKRHQREQQALQIERDRHWTSRYTEAVSQLGESSRTTNYGGLYALQRLAIETQDPKDSQMIVNLLSAYIRSHAGLRERGGALRVGGEQEMSSPSEIVTDAFGSISEISRTQQVSGDFHQANLEGLVLYNKRLIRARFAETNLAHASLIESKLQFAVLDGANLRDSDLSGASLYYATLRNADLEGARLRGANLRGCSLRMANLAGVDLRGADLADAREFSYRQLESAGEWDAKTIWPKGHNPSSENKGWSGGVVTVVRDK